MPAIERRMRRGVHQATDGAIMPRLRLLLTSAATLALAACGEASTAPRQVTPGARSSDVISCRSGYHIATRDDGTQYCAPDDGTIVFAPTTATATPTSHPAPTSTH